MDQDDEEGEDEKEADVVEVEVEVAEEIDFQSERVSKPVRDVRKRVDATRILTTEDFQLIGTSLSLSLSPSVTPPRNVLSFNLIYLISLTIIPCLFLCITSINFFLMPCPAMPCPAHQITIITRPSIHPILSRITLFP